MAGQQPLFPRLLAQHMEARSSGWSRVDLGGHEVVARLHMRIKAGPEAAGEGRHALDRLEGSVDPEQLAELRLLVTELLTNSVRHATEDGDWIGLDVDIYANAVRVVVTDRGPGFHPEPTPQPHVDRSGGWGLCLVDRLADRWGVEHSDETSVWFEVDRSPFATAA
jgi:anti-sigma regulatory factor (Ser/Thr protein kinase)